MPVQRGEYVIRFLRRDGKLDREQRFRLATNVAEYACYWVKHNPGASVELRFDKDSPDAPQEEK